ncbi:urea active transporter [[Candida] railenensis]|uniref:Urea active transporter n=1 Tax=[Candida] railenensis TaxID=45579 RepID=A0A9P0VWV8_9ASCO|nr:urea active transporter [[Candida] railenensis]
MSGTTTEVHLLGQAPGYGVLVGVGAFFAISIVIATKLMSRYLHENAKSTEMFMVANRTVGIGLTASAVFSSWTWATEFLWSVTMVYNYGVMSSFYFASGLALHICLMTVVGILSKKRIPSSHTCLELVDLRYGKACHLLFLFLCLVNNLLSCSFMILGAAGAISVIAGNLHIAASSMLIPFGVLLYTSVGGLKSTFLTDFIHTFILLIILCYINTAVISSPLIGGLDGLYDKVIQHEGSRYIEGNYKGSFLTGKSEGAIIFGIIHTIGNLGLTVMDSSFWQKSFSSNIHSAVPGYLLAAVFIFANVWPLGTIIGLSNIVLEDSPAFPTYPRKMSTYEINSGFGTPYVLKAVLGDGALGGMLLVFYLSVTSTVSAQMISVSSIISFDIYKKYIRPGAQNKQLIRVSHFGVVFFGLFSAGFSIMLHYVGVDNTWMGYFISMVICPGVVPLVLTITWDGQTALGAFVGPVAGVIVGIAVWLSTAYHWYGEISIVSTGQQLPCLYGGLTAILLPAILSVVISLTIKPHKFDWEKFKEARIIVATENDEGAEKNKSDDEEKSVSTGKESVKNDFTIAAEPIDSPDAIAKEKKRVDLLVKIAWGAFIFVFLLTWVLWPLPLYRDYIWSKEFFRGWTTVSLIWIYLAFLAIGVYPLYDGRRSLYKVFNGVYQDYVKRKGK